MKRLFALCFCLAFVFLSACGSESADVTGESTAAETTESVRTVVRDDVVSANDSYDEVSKIDGISVTDRSVQYRTEDSFRLQPVAVRAALDLIRESLAKPDSLKITNVNVWNCADDGTSVYYSIYLNTTSLVGTGERVRRVYYYDLGVRKSDETAFDASGSMEQVLEAYSVFLLQAERDSVVDDLSSVDTDAFESAARIIALSRLKNAQTGTILSAVLRRNESDGTVSVWDVLCEGENDFGMRIADVYTVYLRFEDGKIVEFDPAEDVD